MNHMLSLKQLCLLFSLLTCLVIAGSGQCLVTSGGDSETTEATDYNWMYGSAWCGGASCPNGNFIFFAEGRGSPCSQHEPATVTMNRGRTNPNDGIFMTYAIRGQRSGWLFKYGGLTQLCDGSGSIFDEPVLPCLPCDMFVPESCEHRPGPDSRYARCSIDPLCTASCVNPAPHVGITIWDWCPYPSDVDHSVEVIAFSRSNGTFPAGAYAEGTVYVWGYPYCVGTQKHLCNGTFETDIPVCGCAFPE